MNSQLSHEHNAQAPPRPSRISPPFKTFEFLPATPPPSGQTQTDATNDRPSVHAVKRDKNKPKRASGSASLLEA